MRFKRKILSVVVASLFLALGAAQQAAAHEGGLPAKLGKAHFKVSCNEAAQKEFDVAIAL
jgi:hypothetical protein